MQVTFDELVQTIADHGEEWNISMADVAAVGIDCVLDGIKHQCDARTSAFYGTEFHGMESHAIENAIADYFCDGSFDMEYDRMFSCR